ncbi:MAG: hypothetical protein ABJC39_12370 [Chloroflexota bacterium]
MNVGIGRRLRFVFKSEGEASLEVLPGDVTTRPSPRIDFVAYAEECILSGRFPMGADRLTDALNERDEYELVDVLVERLSDGMALEVSSLDVSRRELLLVQASGPRGNLERRRRKRLHPMVIQIGPYRVRGYLHALPGADPVGSIQRRKPMVPLTDARVDYMSAAGAQRLQLGTVLVNHERMDWIVPAIDNDVELPELPELRGVPTF